MEAAARKLISSGSPFEPRIGFSRAVRVGPFVAVSGTAPIAPDGGVAAPGDVYGQTKRCLEIIGQALAEVGAEPSHVVRTRVYLVDADDWEGVGHAHGEVFADIRPATSFVVVASLLDPAWLVEIEAEAIVP